MNSIEKNFISQAEEIEVLKSIYGKDWTTESDHAKSYTIRIVYKKNEVLLTVTLPDDYPSQSPPNYDISAPWMDRKTKGQLYNVLCNMFYEHIGEAIIHKWVEKIRESLQNMRSPKQKKKVAANDLPKGELQCETKCPVITHGEVITDRKSSFQGHAAEVHSLDEVKAVLAKLKENKKIVNAKHNVYAYRFGQTTAKGAQVQQDCSDDGEAQAGGRVLHLLQMLDQRDTLVVVTRWFGGIQIGADRFRHYNNATRQAIEHAGLLKKKHQTKMRTKASM